MADGFQSVEHQIVDSWLRLASFIPLHPDAGTGGFHLNLPTGAEY